MPQLSDSGQQIVQRLSSRYGLSADAVTHMMIAVHHGNGTMAQFGHPEFGGAGQWMRGGMTMVSDLFNNQLKSLVDSLCSELSNELANHQSTPLVGSSQSQSQSGSGQQSQASGGIGSGNSLFVPDAENLWWPQDLGTPSAIGSQNNTRYAYFANSRRLAVSTGGDVWVYDTGDHQIGGFSQQQGVGGSLAFTSQFGTVNLNQLPVLVRSGVPVREETPASPASQNAESSATIVNAPSSDVMPSTSGTGPLPNDSDGILATIEKLGSLLEKGLLSQQEFDSKKSDLLNRL